MTISIGTFDDLKGWNEPQPIDRNPTVPCHVCDETAYDWETWQEKYDEITPETKLRCDECWNRVIEQARIERKREQNQSITEYE